MEQHRIPAFVNASARSAKKVIDTLRADTRFQVTETSPESLRDEVAACVARGEEKVVVAGGDGTLAAAASQLVDQPTALAVVPGGTLNHFAKALSLPTDPEDALELVFDGRRTQIDAAYVNDRLFLNTSSVGAYVSYVRIRDRYDDWLGYVGASLVAALHTLWALSSIEIAFEVKGKIRRYRSPLIFIGVGERELRPPKLGQRKDAEHQRGLHVMIVRPTTRLRLLLMGLRMLVGGVRPWARENELESFFVERCKITLPEHLSRAAIDGEIVKLTSPLTYRFRHEAFTVLVPDSD